MLTAFKKKEDVAEKWFDGVASQADLRVLYVVHNHPSLAPGGAEIFAYNLFQEFKNQKGLAPFFLAASSHFSNEMHDGTAFQSIEGRNDEMLFWGDRYEYFIQSQRNLPLLYEDFAGFLKEYQPHIVHFQHIQRVGIEAIKVVRQTLPDAKIVMTLHEYNAICHRDGQMVRRQDNSLCERADPIRCHQCFPDISSQRFKMREQFIKTHFDLVDCFVSPSKFLARKYTEWGIAEKKIKVIKNGHAGQESSKIRKLKGQEMPNRFAYFGQITPYKGVDVLLEAVGEMVRSGFNQFTLDIFGNMSLQQSGFQEKIKALLDGCKSNVLYHGSYTNDELPYLIQEYDWLITPSIWWENAPLVIDEAFMHNRPVICSGIGGMAEKVQHGVNGLHFKEGSITGLARTMQYACQENGLWKHLSKNIQRPLAIKECAKQHQKLYKSLLSA